MAIEVVPLTEADIPGAIQVIQRAFEDDPYYKWVFDASTSMIHNRPLPLSLESPAGWLHSQLPSLRVGTPGIKGGSFRSINSSLIYDILDMGGLRTNRYWIWKENQQKAQAQIWDDPRGYYFCNIVAVSPEAQGKGIGKLLFETVIKRADQEGIKCYLESSKNVPNVQIYEGMGFEMSREMECRDGSDACMRYDPYDYRNTYINA
ncbi:N-acetyltransferase [Penicillium cosmopolitanum]|uniref:N-acetyltransferase n=1 Tax=Penicillium cosmopolitanum TaxID=1131564 RepID=A0A9W9VY63_9EURO|nr:N-acetyltransferase [Penicillium cosmopolitanum]KAJ5391623.1 N-acetyltransferase [Penicillium cosmopolitanum]